MMPAVDLLGFQWRGPQPERENHQKDKPPGKQAASLFGESHWGLWFLIRSQGKRVGSGLSPRLCPSFPLTSFHSPLPEAMKSLSPQLKLFSEESRERIHSY